MNVQVVQHDVLFGRGRITGDQALKVRKPILLGACGPPRRFKHLPRNHIEVDEPGQRAMSDVLEFSSEDMSRLHGQIRVFALKRLHLS